MKQILKKILPQELYGFIRLQKSNYNNRKVRDKLVFEVHVVEHCNLNCSGCNNFSCLASEAYIDINSYRNDLCRLRSIFGNKIERITLLGGEPLLNPMLPEICILTRKIFPENNININIVTNGTLIKKVDTYLWDVCKKEHIEVIVTRYPITFDYESVKKFLCDKGVFNRYADGTENGMKTMSCFPLDITGKQNPKKSFSFCGRANTCITLKQGKLYPCTMIPNICFFNDAFSQNIPVTNEDYVDIYKESDPQKILERFTKPFPACAYCDTRNIVDGIKWSVTKKDIREWTLA